MEHAVPYSQSVMGEMASWKKLEESFKAICDEETFKSRQFRQMRLAEFDRICNTYQNRAHTRDEKAWLVIALIERRKLEKALYPSIIIRLMRRVLNSLLPVLDFRQELAMAQQDLYGKQHIMDNYTGNGMGQTKEFTPDGNQQRQHWGADLGRKSEDQQGKSQHL